MNTGVQLPPRRIAVIRPCCIGDCVMALPAIDALAHAYPAAQLDVYVGDHSRAVFDGRWSITATYRAHDIYDASRSLQLGLRLRSKQYDTVVVLDRSRWLRLAARGSGAATVAAIPRGGAETRHESEVFLETIRRLQINTPWDRPVIVPDSRWRAEAKQILSHMQLPVVVLHPGGAENPGVRMLTKRWPAERFSALASRLQARGLSVAISGGPADRDLALQIAREAGVPDAQVLAGSANLMTTAAVIERASLYVGGDTGVSHLAGAVGTSCVVLFGPTNPRRYRPLGAYVEVLAPPDSWRLPDVDLRRDRAYPEAAAIDRVTLEATIEACARALGVRQGMISCGG